MTSRPDSRPNNKTVSGECQTTQDHDSRCWERTVFVPDGMQPVDLIAHFSGDLPLPPFHALQLTVNKKDVECIASAMTNPSLRWRNLYHFTIAPYDGPNPEWSGQWVLISGHHRFLAYLLSGTSPSEKCPLRVSKAPLATSLFPWSDVIWGK